MHAGFVPVYLLLITPITLSWWASGSYVMDPNQICKRARKSRGKTADICNHRPDLVRQISIGIGKAQAECQYQFRYRRWNCTSSKRSMKKVMLRDTRETGFVNAIIAAGITYQVTKACTRGDLLGCSCDKRTKSKILKKKFKHQAMPPGGDWKWEGCGGENINFGIKKSKDFLDMRNKNRSDVKNLVKLHNYVAGRLAIKNYMRTECKCHGLSASCTLRTCSRRMPHFREVGNRLKERFDGAAKVIAGNDGQSFMPEGRTIKPPDRVDLVYSEESPNFCAPNHTLGSFGTQHRVCNGTSPGEEGCVILCCGRGYDVSTIEVQENCNCEFKWCCDVICKQCTIRKTLSTCK